MEWVGLCIEEGQAVCFVTETLYHYPHIGIFAAPQSDRKHTLKAH